MSKADVVAAAMWIGVTLYAVFGGADFGAGFWHLVSERRGDPLGAAARERIQRSIGPVWEANHVWLIFALVVLWTGFPRAFAPVMETLYLPLALAAAGIVLRGSGFAFEHVMEGRRARWAGVLFAVSSILTPFFMGTVVGAVAAGEVVPGGHSDAVSPWIGPLPLLVGALFVASGAYLAAIFLLDDCRRAGEDELAAWFRRCALGAAGAAGALALAGIFVLRADARYVYDGLTGPGLPLLIASLVLGAAVVGGLLRGARRALRPLAIGALVAVIWGWGVAQHPYLLPGQLTIAGGAGAEPALAALIVVTIAAAVVVGPALALLYRLAQNQALDE